MERNDYNNWAIPVKPGHDSRPFADKGLNNYFNALIDV